jgi:glycosyltransferase involved in cell wall biosynthesis
MPDTVIDVSYVVPVYNKSGILSYFLDSLSVQEGDFNAEYIFVDDASTDQTRDVLRRETADWPNVVIIENADNAGPAIRINQGAARARGRYLCLVDPDEVLAVDAVASMVDLLESREADVVHGKWRTTGDRAADVVAQPIGATPRHLVSDHPLDTVLGRGFVRMTWLVRRTLFERAGGCDERVFIQDESLPLRLCLHARRFIDLREVVTYVPAGGEHLSENKAQQHHDRFFAYYLFLGDTPALTEGQRRAVYRKCVSSAWKSAREGRLSPVKLRFLARYLASRLGRDRPDDTALRDIARYFADLPGVRRPGRAVPDG